MNIPKLVIYFRILIIRIISIFSDGVSDDDGDAPFFYFQYVFYFDSVSLAH